MVDGRESVNRLLILCSRVECLCHSDVLVEELLMVLVFQFGLESCDNLENTTSSIFPCGNVIM